MGSLSTRLFAFTVAGSHRRFETAVLVDPLYTVRALM